MFAKRCAIFDTLRIYFRNIKIIVVFSRCYESYNSFEYVSL